MARLSDRQSAMLRRATRDRVEARGNQGSTVEALARRGYLRRCEGQSILGQDYEITSDGREALANQPTKGEG